MTAAALLDQLTGDRTVLIRRQAEADRVVAASSAGHLVHEMTVHGAAGRRPWRVDPVPLVLDGATFERLAAGVVERVAALEVILADLYGGRSLVADGIVPGEALSSTPRYRIGDVGQTPRRWLTTYAADVVLLADGTWRIVRDLTDAPTGIGYALIDRTAMLPVLDEVPGLGNPPDNGVASLAGLVAVLRRALFATTVVASPRIVLLSGGADHAGYVEDSQLARLLGVTLVERPDLVVRQRRLWLRTLGGFDPIDVVYRRIEDDATDPVELAAPGGGGVPGLLAAVTAGGVTLANAHGCGLAEDAALASYWSAAAEALTGRALRLPRLGEASRRANLATFPAFAGGELGEAPVVLRLHAVAGPGGVTVIPGGNGRVLLPGDDPQRPTARVVKDVWVIDTAKSLPAIVTPLPQVDLAASVPTRAADAMFWTGRAAERAEAIARTLRVIASRRRQDPMLVTIAGGQWSRRVAAALRALAGAAPGDADHAGIAPRRGPVVDIDAAVVSATDVLAERLRTFVAEAASVGEFLPASSTRVLANIASLVEEFDGRRASLGALDDVLGALAAFSGMWNESTVRGPAWRFGDIGVRLERMLVVVGLAAPLITDGGGDGTDVPDVADVADVAMLEVLLAANESLVAYRRQHRSDVDTAATLELLLHDRDNPRGVLLCLDRLSEHVADVGWASAVTRVAALAGDVEAMFAAPEGPAAAVGAGLAGIGDAVRALADDVVATWFATPVKPVPMRAGRAAAR